jgi:NTP pyrophosphatase (non-canonical NTP hydrolase)
LKQTETPINTLQQLMAITAEECGELTQVCMKYLRRYENIEQIDDKYRQKLLEEVGDVYCMIDLLLDHGFIDEDLVYQRAQIKREKLKTWSTLINDTE